MADVLEDRLRSIGADLAVPRVDVVAVVSARVSARGTTRRAPAGPFRLPRSARRVVLIAVAAVLLLGAAALAGRLGVPGLRIIFEPGPTPSASLAPIGTNLFLGRPTSVADARTAVGLPVATPHGAGLGSATVYVGARPAGGRVSLVYPPGPGLPRSVYTNAGLLITEFDGSVDPSFIKKLTFTGTRIRDVVVNGDQGVWFSGEPHVLVYVDRNGSEFEDSERLAGNTLVWSHDGVTYRLECRCGPAKALAIASTMR